MLRTFEVARGSPATAYLTKDSHDPPALHSRDRRPVWLDLPSVSRPPARTRVAASNKTCSVAASQVDNSYVSPAVICVLDEELLRDRAIRATESLPCGESCYPARSRTAVMSAPAFTFNGLPRPDRYEVDLDRCSLAPPSARSQRAAYKALGFVRGASSRTRQASGKLWPHMLRTTR